jgi:Transposase DNA-binding/Transposase Tn5 dimerisation domain
MTPSVRSQPQPSLPTALWAAQIAAATPLPDARLNTRLQRLLTQLADKPLDAFPQAMSDWHQTKATYRFLANVRVESADLLTGLRDTTAAAFPSLPRIYVIHDTTTCSYSSLKHTTGLGYVNDLEAARGLHCHSSLALRPDGVALGLLHQHYWARLELRQTRAQDRDPEDKESIKWLHGLDATKQALDTLPAEQRPHVVHIMDREGDIHEVFARVLAWGHGAIIRRYRNRSVAEDPGDADGAIWQAPVLARVRLKLPASRGRKARTAVVELRTRDMTLTPHRHVEVGRRPVRLTMVAVREVSIPPHGDEPIEWLLWTTEPARTKKQILAVVRTYALRWRIEDFHLVWKQGCRVEQLQLETRERLEKALILYAGVAVRLLRLRDLARQEPEAPCTEVLSEEEWRALYVHVTGEVPDGQTPVPTVAQAVKWIGRLGGHLGRKRDGMPGVRTLWRGWRDLAVLVAGYRAGQQVGRGGRN